MSSPSQAVHTLREYLETALIDEAPCRLLPLGAIELRWNAPEYSLTEHDRIFADDPIRLKLQLGAHCVDVLPAYDLEKLAANAVLTLAFAQGIGLDALCASFGSQSTRGS